MANNKGNFMSYEDLSAGDDLPNEVNVLIEIPMDSGPIKYEYDKDSGFLMVDRISKTPMYYPGNYGFIPHTLSGDGDPVDVLVISRLPIQPGAVLPSRPIGVLMMEDEKGEDEKIIAVPTDSIHPIYSDIKTIDDFPQIMRDEIQFFFENYKNLDKNKWVKVSGWGDANKALDMIRAGVDRANNESKAA